MVSCLTLKVRCLCQRMRQLADARSAKYVRNLPGGVSRNAHGRLYPAELRARASNLVGPLLAYDPRGGDFGLRTWAFIKVLYEQGDISTPVFTTTVKYGAYGMNYAVALFVMYYVLHKTFRTFRIALSENWGTPEARILEPTVARSTRIWWTYTWRTIVYMIIVYVAAMLPLSAFVGILSAGSPAAVLFTFVTGFLLGGAAALLAIYSNILDEDFGNFHVTLVPRTIRVLGAEIVRSPAQARIGIKPDQGQF